MSRLHIVQKRGGHVESRHEVSAVIADANGRILERVGPPITTTWRSAAKPFQLETSLAALDSQVVAALDDRDLAIGSSSHNAEPLHVVQVRSVLARFGCDVGDLYCGTHWPGTPEATKAMFAAGREPSALHNNCSGKHAYMAAACRAQGWDPDYRPFDHPLQQRIRATVDRRSGGTCLDVVIDGCGVPCFVLPIDGMARAWAQVAVAMRTGDEPLGRIGRAMNARWWHASGTGTLDGAVIQHARRPVVAKVGAQGLLCVALAEEGVGLVLKVHTASDTARAAATPALLERFFPGLVPVEAFEPWTVIANWVGTICGEQTAEWA